MVFLCKGLRPLHSRGLNGRGTGIARRKPSLGALPGRRKPVLQKSQLPARYLYGRICKCRRRFSTGVPGAEPPAKLTYSLPLPAGKGVGGMRERKHTEGRVSRRPKRQAPPCAPPTPQPPRAAGDKPPLGAWFAPLLRCPLRFSPGDARGEAPCIRKIKSPPSRWEERSASGVGGMWARKQAKGMVGRRQSGHATAEGTPPPAPERHASHPVTAVIEG